MNSLHTRSTHYTILSQLAAVTSLPNIVAWARGGDFAAALLALYLLVLASYLWREAKRTWRYAEAVDRFNAAWAAWQRYRAANIYPLVLRRFTPSQRLGCDSQPAQGDTTP